MTLGQLLQTLTVKGFQLKSDGEDIKLTGPCHRLTPDLRQAIRDNKPALFELLSRPSYEQEERYCIQHENDLLPPPGTDLDEWFSLLPIPKDPPVAKPAPKRSASDRHLGLLDEAKRPVHNNQDASGYQPRDASNRNL